MKVWSLQPWNRSGQLSTAASTSLGSPSLQLKLILSQRGRSLRGGDLYAGGDLYGGRSLRSYTHTCTSIV